MRRHVRNKLTFKIYCGKKESLTLYNLNLHPLQVVSRWRDLQLEGGENYSDL